jgi:hypothetical protein
MNLMEKIATKSSSVGDWKNKSFFALLAKFYISPTTSYFSLFITQPLTYCEQV